MSGLPMLRVSTYFTWIILSRFGLYPVVPPFFLKKKLNSYLHLTEQLRCNIDPYGGQRGKPLELYADLQNKSCVGSLETFDVLGVRTCLVMRVLWPLHCLTRSADMHHCATGSTLECCADVVHAAARILRHTCHTCAPGRIVTHHSTFNGQLWSVAENARENTYRTSA